MDCYLLFFKLLVSADQRNNDDNDAVFSRVYRLFRITRER